MTKSGPCHPSDIGKLRIEQLISRVLLFKTRKILMKNDAFIVGINVLILGGCFFICDADTNSLPAATHSPKTLDEVKLQEQITIQNQRLVDETDPPGIAHVAGYSGRGFDHRRHWNTNTTDNWRGIWAENSNGWRVNLRMNGPHLPNVETMTVHVGSIVTNSGAGLLPTPDGKYARLELFDSSGNTIQPRMGAAAILYNDKNAVLPAFENEHVNNHPPNAADATVEENYPDTISDLEYSRWKNGAFLEFAGFVSNGPPCQVGYIKFDDIFSIKTEGDYQITVQPVLYRMHYDCGTFQGYLERVDLPCVSTTIHLVPGKFR
jgi:hypothetical protein